jgi:hypothetical protein
MVFLPDKAHWLLAAGASVLQQRALLLLFGLSIVWHRGS